MQISSSDLRRADLRRVSRRQALKDGGLLLGALALSAPLAGLARASSPDGPGAPSRELLASSPLVYVSPLLADGSESRCHGEVWFFGDGEDVVVATGKDAWKARALRGGLDRARIWVGDFGAYSGAKDEVAAAPRFDARASWEPDRAVFDRLLEVYARKYSGVWAKWKPRFESSFEDGSRLMIRYQPIQSSSR